MHDKYGSFCKSCRIIFLRILSSYSLMKFRLKKDFHSNHCARRHWVCQDDTEISKIGLHSSELHKISDKKRPRYRFGKIRNGAGGVGNAERDQRILPGKRLIAANQYFLRAT